MGDARDMSAAGYSPADALQECYESWAGGAWPESSARQNLQEVMAHVEKLLDELCEPRYDEAGTLKLASNYLRTMAVQSDDPFADTYFRQAARRLDRIGAGEALPEMTELDHLMSGEDED